MALPEYIALLQSEWGWAIVLVVGLYEIGWPWWETRFQATLQTISEPVREDVNRIESKIDCVDEKTDDIHAKQVSSIQVIRAISRQIGGIDDERVDEYLVDNGVHPEEFVVEHDDGEDTSLSSELTTDRTDNNSSGDD